MILLGVPTTIDYHKLILDVQVSPILQVSFSEYLHNFVFATALRSSFEFGVPVNVFQAGWQSSFCFGS